MKYRPYKKSLSHSYAIGAYPTIELLKNQPDHAQIVYLSDKINSDLKNTIVKSAASHAPTETSTKTIARLSGNTSTSVIGVFTKYQSSLNANAPHIILARPDDMGNLGTILRSMIGFGYTDLAIIEPALDYFNPKVIRSSMGAIFSCNVACFDSLATYQASFKNHAIYPFVPDKNAQPLNGCSFRPKHSLLFGNEGSGLLPSEVKSGTSVFIEQTNQIDSLNLGVTASIAMYQARNRT